MKIQNHMKKAYKRDLKETIKIISAKKPITKFVMGNYAFRHFQEIK